MIVNNTNIEGVCTEEELATISLEDSEVINHVIEIKIPSKNKIKEVIEIYLKVNVENYKCINFEDKKLVLDKINTDLDILYVEDNENNLVSFVDKHIEFIYSYKLDNNKELNINAKLIEWIFNRLDDNSIVATLIYLVKKNEEQADWGNKEKENVNKYKLIDVEEEFY